MFPRDTSVLVVDDMMTMRKLVKKAFTSLGFNRVTEAENGAVAFEKIRFLAQSGAPIQLIISDWNMPEMTGIELLKKVRESSFGRNTPFILLTAESEKSQVLEALQARVSGYLVKPFTTDQISEKLKAVYDGIHKKAA